ncbi:MAG: porin family protein [Deltaproteobacteria bacterium]|nr:porin family protein [Deltaproteobacteria bacterium]
MSGYRKRRFVRQLGILLVLSIIIGIGAAGWAWAEDEVSPYYLALRGGPGWAQDATRTSGPYETDMNFEGEYAFNLAYGRRISHFRLEGEVGYVNMSLDKRVSVGGVSREISGSDKHYTLMVNGLADWRNSSPVTPFIGLGVGPVYTRLDTSFPIRDGSTVKTDDAEWAFGYQLMAGLALTINPHIELELMYRFYGTTQRSHTQEANITQVDVDGTQAHFICLGLRYCF